MKIKTTKGFMWWMGFYSGTMLILAIYIFVNNFSFYSKLLVSAFLFFQLLFSASVYKKRVGGVKA
jgi:hypothetical protein